MTFGEQVDVWRKAARISQNELERRIGRSSGYLSRVIDGTIRPSEELCRSIGGVLEEFGAATTAQVIDAAVPYAAEPWIRRWFEARIVKLERPDYLAELEAENRRLRTALDHVRFAIEGVSPPAE